MFKTHITLNTNNYDENNRLSKIQSIVGNNAIHEQTGCEIKTNCLERYYTDAVKQSCMLMYLPGTSTKSISIFTYRERKFLIHPMPFILITCSLVIVYQIVVNKKTKHILVYQTIIKII